MYLKLIKYGMYQVIILCYMCIKDFCLSLYIVIIELMLVKVQYVMRT